MPKQRKRTRNSIMKYMKHLRTFEAQTQTAIKYLKYEYENKALFMDLDHTIIKPKSGKTFPVNIDDWMFVPGVLKIMKKFSDDGYKIIIVSNQGGIEMKYQTEEDTLKKFHNITKEAKSFGVDITKFFYCITNFKDHFDRKPNPGMAFKAEKEFNLDLKESVMVGDLDTDKEFARNARIPTYYDIKEFLNL